MSSCCDGEETVILQGAGDSGVTTPLEPSFLFPILSQIATDEAQEGAELEPLPPQHFLFLAPEHRDCGENCRRAGVGCLLLALHWPSCGVGTCSALPQTGL